LEFGNFEFEICLEIGYCLPAEVLSAPILFDRTKLVLNLRSARLARLAFFRDIFGVEEKRRENVRFQVDVG